MRAVATRARSLITGYAELLGICAVGITQPVLSAFGDSPEHFAFRGAGTRDIVVFPLLVALVPAAVLSIPGALAGLVSATARRVVHQVAIGAALLVALLQVLHAVGVGGVAKAVIASAGAGVGAWLFGRIEGIRLWTRFMSVFAVALIGLFLFSSAAGELAFAEPPEPVELIIDATAPGPGLPDIVMIVLDELPTALLLDEHGAIDPLRYPNLAELSSSATWYRRNTTVSTYTGRAIPALLTGRLPTQDSGPTWTREPDNLFRLLAGTYHLSVSEALTRLCPVDWCGRSPIAPPPVAAAADAATDPSSEVAPATLERGGLAGLLGDAADLWTDQLALDRDDTPTLTGFEETAEVAVSEAEPTPEDEPIEAVDLPEADEAQAREIEDDAALSAFFVVTDTAGQLPRLDELRSTIRPSDQPTLWFLHLVLPHSPFIFTETGATYAGLEYTATTTADWDETLLTERMSLQMQFTDRLLGDIFDDLREAGMYDDALIVVAADHGANLDRSAPYRRYEGVDTSGVIVSPLLIKTPRQATGVVSDAPVETIDVVPTIADVLGVEVPWDVDGDSTLAGDPEYVDGACEDVRILRQFAGDLLGAEDQDSDTELELCADDLMAGALEPLLEPVEPTDLWATTNLARRTPFPQLLGTGWDDLGATPSDRTFVLETADVLGGSSPPVGVIDGRVDEAGAEWVAVAVNGTVAGISPLYDKHPSDEADRPDHFAILVPSPLLDETGYDVRVATLEIVDGELRVTALNLSN